MEVAPTISVKEVMAGQLSSWAVGALLEEVRLTPKPGLVDRENNGSHHDLTLQLMERSARSLEETFFEMAMVSFAMEPSRYLRERLAAIGRHGEELMLRTTGGINTHKGAIWVLGLLTGSAAALLSGEKHSILKAAGRIAGFEDRYAPMTNTNGDGIRRQYTLRTAREEAIAGFPSLQQTALPVWDRFRTEPEPVRKLNVLLALISVVDDTCILHRSNMDVLKKVRQMAGDIIRKGGMGRTDNAEAYLSLDRFITHHHVSPGGSADLLAATIFLQKIANHYKIN